MSLDKINKRNVIKFYNHLNRYLINDINEIVAFYRIGDNGEKEPIDLLRLNFLLSSKNITTERIAVVKKNIIIVEKYSCGIDVFGYKAVELDFFGGKLNIPYNNFIPNTDTNKKIFPAIYYRWQLEESKNINNNFVDIRYLIGVIETNKQIFKETIDLFEKEKLLFKFN